MNRPNTTPSLWLALLLANFACGVFAQSGPPEPPPYPFLDSYSFSGTNFLSDLGYPPAGFSNALDPDAWDGPALFSSPNLPVKKRHFLVGRMGSTSSNHGGWAFNYQGYITNLYSYYGMLPSTPPLTASAAALLSDSVLPTNPFFNLQTPPLPFYINPFTNDLALLVPVAAHMHKQMAIASLRTPFPLSPCL